MASVRSSWYGVFLVMPSMRAAVFVVSPIAVYSTRRSDPTFPDSTGPLFKPIPIRKPSPEPRSRTHALTPRKSRRQHFPSGGESTIGVVIVLLRRGAPKTAMIPSPM